MSNQNTGPQPPAIQALAEEAPADANPVTRLEPATPNLGLPLPGYTLDVDLARLRDALLKVDDLSVSLEGNNERAAATADAALEVAERAKREAERAAEKAWDAMRETESKATAEDVAAHNAEKDAHGAASEAEPGTIALRDGSGCVKSATPNAAEDAATKDWTENAIAGAVDEIESFLEVPDDGKAYSLCGKEWVTRNDQLAYTKSVSNVSFPRGVYRVQVIGGGGGGGGRAYGNTGYGYGGEAGQYVEKFVILANAATGNIVVGAGGTKGTDAMSSGHTSGRAGGASSALGISASGGAGGTSQQGNSDAAIMAGKKRATNYGGIFFDDPYPAKGVGGKGSATTGKAGDVGVTCTDGVAGIVIITPVAL